ncbi:hypothetical protein ISS30_08795 [bacterium]|nr:hypothetical protein [FCB group bacterium]MBL7191781.1 hypothetical protein [bacterium]
MKASEPKPFVMPDFVEERETQKRIKSKVEQVTRLAAEQLDMVRRQHETRSKKFQERHQQELAKVKAESFEAGRQQGLSEADERVERALMQLEKTVKEMVNAGKDFFRNAEKNVIELALAVSRRILGREVETDKEIIVHSVREALKRVADKVQVNVHVNPEDMAVLENHREELQRIDRNLPELKFVSDERVDRGGCVIRTRTGAVDGRLESQLEEIERNFLKK